MAETEDPYPICFALMPPAVFGCSARRGKRLIIHVGEVHAAGFKAEVLTFAMLFAITSSMV
jgi:hypothetical protein